MTESAWVSVASRLPADGQVVLAKAKFDSTEYRVKFVAKPVPQLDLSLSFAYTVLRLLATGLVSTTIAPDPFAVSPVGFSLLRGSVGPVERSLFSFLRRLALLPCWRTHS